MWLNQGVWNKTGLVLITWKTSAWPSVIMQNELLQLQLIASLPSIGKDWSAKCPPQELTASSAEPRLDGTLSTLPDHLLRPRVFPKQCWKALQQASFLRLEYDMGQDICVARVRGLFGQWHLQVCVFSEIYLIFPFYWYNTKCCFHRKSLQEDMRLIWCSLRMAVLFAGVKRERKCGGKPKAEPAAYWIWHQL